jgi:copper oxidase (laccase) domain-containing protein
MASFRFIETFPALDAVEGLVHAFILKHPEIDVVTDRETALKRLEEHHHTQLAALGIDHNHLATGDQVHGKIVFCCDPLGGAVNALHNETDGLATATVGQFIGVFVADCGAVYIADPIKRACALVHSGKKGSELGIAAEAISLMKRHYGSNPADLVVQIAPCIRPPMYEIDFAVQIIRSCEKEGVPTDQIHDCGTCTTSDPDLYYSYRLEKGKTGRLFAVIGWKS